MARPEPKPSQAQMEEILKARDEARIRDMPLPESKPSEREIAEMQEAGRQEFRDNKQRVIDHLKKRGLSNAAIAGIVGNIDVETGGSFDYTQRQTRSGDPRDPRTIESGGYGLFQFDDPRNKAGHETWYKQYLEDKNKEDSAESQLDYFLDMVMAGEDSQDPNYKYAKNMGGRNAGTIKAYLQTNTNPAQISDAITDRFELPGIQHSDRRRESAEKTFAELAPLERNEFVPSIPDESDAAQYLNQPGEIRDTDTEVPIVDVPEEESTFQKIKPYIPILRHFNEGGMSTTESEMQTYPITEDMIEALNSMTEEEREAFRKRIMSRAIEDMQRGERFMKPLSTEGENSLKKLRRYYEKGGVAKQMELFEDGGLMDEGGTVDPISGNDVPPGSTQEEVRDDIPAQLSEGEFVFPADVVRFIGLEKLMQMRQQAKMGLQMMEDMGQMGNSDEATMPDNLPFDINDLDMEDDLEYNVGGFVPGVQQQQQFTGIAGYRPPQMQQGVGSYVPASMPQYQTTQMPGAYVPPQQAAVPTTQVPTQMPQFEQFTEQNVETREYTNSETGEKRVFTFINGQPTVPIPAGFVPSSEYVKPETSKPEDVKVETASVVSPSDDEADARRRAEEVRQFGETGARLGVGTTSYGISYDTESGVMPGIMGAIGIGAQAVTGKLPKSTIVNFKSFDDEFSVTGDQYNDLKDIIKEHGAKSDRANNFLSSLKNNFNENVKEVAATYGLDSKADTKEVLKQAREESGQSNDDLIRGAQIRRELAKHNQEVREKAAARREAQQVAQVSDEGDMGPVYTPGREDSGGSQPSASREGSYFSDIGRQSFDQTRDEIGLASGGMAAKPKPKVKKMKRGGLASKK